MGTRAAATRVALALVFVGLSSTTSAQSGVDSIVPIEASLPATSAAQSDPLAPLDEAFDSMELSSGAAAQLTNWVIASRDNGGAPFIVIDKATAKVFVFDAAGVLLGAAPALLGVTVGDESAPGIGDRELRKIPPQERTTPAGRFVAKFGPAAGHQKVLWVDYATALSLHPVVPGTRKERRLNRLRSKTADDNRITYGCINVPTKFYSNVVRPLFKDTTGVVYILPETKPLNEVFLAL